MALATPTTSTSLRDYPTLIGAPAEALSPFLGAATAYDFDQVNDYIKLDATTITAGVVGNSFAVSFNIDATVSGTTGLVAELDAGNANRKLQFFYNATTGHLHCTWFDHRYHNLVAISDSTISTGTDYRFMCTVDGNNDTDSISMYLNGAPFACTTVKNLGGYTGNNPYGSVTTMKVGTADYGSSLAKGLISDMFMWTQIVNSADDALEDYNNFVVSAETSKSNPMSPDTTMLADGTMFPDGAMMPNDSMMKL